MCELLGMSFNMAVNPHISFRAFRSRGESNPDGWGLAYYPDSSCQIFKEEIKAGASPLSKFLMGYEKIRSRTIIGHVRHKSRGDSSRRNTHPFSRELHGKEFVFAHNGTLDGCEALDTGHFEPIGDTDSERAFCYILDRIRQENIVFRGKEQFEWLAHELNEINEYGDLNCILSDGEFLFCYHDRKGYNQLCLQHRKPPYERIRLKDEDWEIDLAAEKGSEQTGYVIATTPLTDEEWVAFAEGELRVFKEGREVYRHHEGIGGSTSKLA